MQNDCYLMTRNFAENGFFYTFFLKVILRYIKEKKSFKAWNVFQRNPLIQDISPPVLSSLEFPTKDSGEIDVTLCDGITWHPDIKPWRRIPR